jgi:Legume lectin domain/Chitobiase/beta-hexosaminidase C-terminal domain
MKFSAINCYKSVKILIALLPLTSAMFLFENCSGGFQTSSGGAASSASVATPPTLASTATPVFSYLNGFADSSSAIRAAWEAVFLDSVIALTPLTASHEGGSAWYLTQQNVQSFTTQFTFQITPPPVTAGNNFSMAFVIQNSNSTTNNFTEFGLTYGTNAGGDANVGGYGSYNISLGANQQPIGNSIEIVFDGGGCNGGINYPSGGMPNATGLYIDGGAYAGLNESQDLNPYKLNLSSGHIFNATIVYDGALLTMVLQDTVTNAQGRYSWPVNIPAVTQGNLAWIGFTAGTPPLYTSTQTAEQPSVLTWSFWNGYSPRLATPTFSVNPGAYTSAQTVAISAPAGANIYYTINGLQPTSSSTLYTGPITVNASEIIQAVAIQSGYTDSLVAVANYQIAPSGAPTINLPTGFSSASNLVIPVGRASFTGSSIQLTDNSTDLEAGAAWYAAPINVQNFTTNFTLQFTKASSTAQIANGMTFTIQNQGTYSPFFSSAAGGSYVSGGPFTFGNNNSSLGYGYVAAGTGTGTTGGIVNSVAIAFDLYTVANSVGLYTDGALPVGNQTSITGPNLTSGDPLSVTLAYNGTTLAITITDTKTNATFSHSWTINIPATVGGNTAYVGFTGGTGYVTAQQQVLNWTYSN